MQLFNRLLFSQNEGPRQDTLTSFLVSWYIPRYILSIDGPLHIYQYTWTLARYLRITDMLQMILRIKELPHFSEDHLFTPQTRDFLQQGFILLP